MCNSTGFDEQGEPKNKKAKDIFLGFFYLKKKFQKFEGRRLLFKPTKLVAKMLKFLERNKAIKPRQ